MPRRHAITALLVAAHGCGPDLVERAELAEVCGEPSPVRVLELPEGVQPLGSYGAVRRIGERVIWVVGRNEFEPNPHHHGYEPPVETTVWACGPCGESPVVVAEDLHTVFERDVWPGEALACSFETGDLAVLDPWGMREAKVLWKGVGCDAVFTPHGLVAVVPHDEETSGLVLHPYPASPWDPMPDPVVLVDPIRAEISRRPSGGSEDTFHVSDDELLALTPTGDLVRASLPAGATTLVQSGAVAFRSSDDGRFVLWQGAEATGDDPEFPAGPVSLLDRTTGTSTWIADTSIDRGLAYVHPGPPLHARVQLGKYFGDATRFVLLENGTTVDTPGKRFVMSPVGDGTRWLTMAWERSSLEDPRHVVAALDGSDETVLHEGMAHTYPDREGIEFLGVSGWIDEAPFDEAELVRVPFDTFEPRLLAERMSIHRHDLEDGRIVTALGVQGHFLGDFVLVDPETLDEAIIDTEVFAYSMGWNAGDPFDGAIAYAVSDGERSGVWLARPLPRAEDR